MKKLKKKTMLRADKVKKCYWTAAGAAVLCLCCATHAMAASGDPLDIVNNLSDFIFSIIKALGVIILGWGIVQVGMSIQSHDASQRTQGLPLPLWWAHDCLCEGNFECHRRDLMKSCTPCPIRNRGCSYIHCGETSPNKMRM